MNIIRIGVVGCGKQAGKHIDSLMRIPGIDLVMGDIDPNLAVNLARKIGITNVDSPENILKDQSVNAVVICTPTKTHFSLIKRALQNGKHVFCEKPLCSSYENTLQLKALEEKTGCNLMVGYIYRFVPIFEEGHRIIREHRIKGESLVLGKPLSAYFRLGGRGSHQEWKHDKELGGGAINEMLVHMIDLACWYFGPVKNVEIISNKLMNPERKINGNIYKADAEDFVLVKLDQGNDVEVYCQADLITPAFSQYVEIQGKNGSFMGSIQSEIPSYIHLKSPRGGYAQGKTDLQYSRRNVLDIQMTYFINSILRNQQPDRNTVEDSLTLIEVMNELRKKLEN